MWLVHKPYRHHNHIVQRQAIIHSKNIIVSLIYYAVEKKRRESVQILIALSSGYLHTSSMGRRNGYGPDRSAQQVFIKPREPFDEVRVSGKEEKLYLRDQEGKAYVSRDL